MDKNDRLTVKQTAFIAHYTDPDSPTFGNGTQSAMIAYNSSNDNTAHVIASENLRKPTIRHRVDKILDTLGYGEKVRLETLTEIGLGKYIKTTKQTKVSLTGEVQSTIITESTPGADSIIKVNDILNKLTGKYETAKQASRIISKSMQRMIDSVTAQASSDSSKRKHIKPAI